MDSVLDSVDAAGSFLDEHTIIAAVAIVVAAFIVAQIVNVFVAALIRVIAKRTKTAIDDRIIESVHGPVVKSVVLVGLWLACKKLENEAAPVELVHHIIITLGILVWLVAALRMSGIILQALAGQRSRYQFVEQRTLPLFDNLAKILLVGLAGFLLISAWNFDPTGWLASAGVAGIAIGFAAKDTLANLFAGVFIIADGPYHVGDYVVLDSGHRGRVTQIGLRSTRILTRDDVHITVPNSIIGNGAIVNETSGAPQYRLRVKVGVAYGSDIDMVRRVLLEVAESQPEALRDPEPRVRFRSFGNSSLEFELLIWICEPELRGRTLDAFNTAVYKRFQAEGISIAFPQQDLHLRSVPEAWTAAFARGSDN